jgi:hypothetical protein
MKHANWVILLLVLAGCSGQQLREEDRPPRGEAHYVGAKDDPGSADRVIKGAMAAAKARANKTYGPGEPDSKKPHDPDGKAKAQQAYEAMRARFDRRSFAADLERELLKRGISDQVFAMETPGQSGGITPGEVPVLMFFGHYSRAAVYQAVADGALLSKARDLGFKTVHFFDRIDGFYVFDLSKTGPLPSCARYRRVCV